MNIEYGYGSARIFKAVNNWLYVSLPMLAVVAFITVPASHSHGAAGSQAPAELEAPIEL